MGDVTPPARRRDGVLVVVGMTREAGIVGARTRVAIGRKGLARALAERPAAILSFGICGALDPSLKVGDLVIGSAVNGVLADPEWAAQLAAALPAARIGSFAAGDAMVADASAKAALRERSGAMAVDMESHAVAQTGIHFAILRAVSDIADRSLPPAARVGLKANGRPDVAAVLKSLVADPSQLPALMRTARDAERAYRALGNALDLLGPGIGRPNLGEHLVDVA